MAERVLVDAADELHVGRGVALQARPLWSVADDHEPPLRHLRPRRDREIDALVGHHPAQHQIIAGGVDAICALAAAAPGQAAKAVQLHRCRHHVRGATVKSLDFRRRIGAVRDEAIDAIQGVQVELTQQRRRRAQGRACEADRGVGAGDIIVGAIPRVAHRRVAIADMHRARARDHGLRDAMARREDEIVACEVERGDRCGVERQQPAMTAMGEGRAIGERAAVAHRLDAGRRDAGRAHQRMQRRLREELT